MRPHPTVTVAEAAAEASRLLGCNCVPEVELITFRPGVVVGYVGHDDNCPALTSNPPRSQKSSGGA